ncbi:hypothetical protein [Streptomyces sp. NBC_01506]|uniref:hypothetical protein n=1 Tax=Streptomyces sp. NBC_01506 TaxID=2903887 RepID=UPI00386FAB3A
MLRGTWDLVTKEEEVPMIGARVIPWAQITDMDCSSPVRNWNREDLERDIKRYGVADAEAQMFLTWV